MDLLFVLFVEDDELKFWFLEETWAVFISFQDLVGSSASAFEQSLKLQDSLDLPTHLETNFRCFEGAAQRFLWLCCPVGSGAASFAHQACLLWTITCYAAHSFGRGVSVDRYTVLRTLT